MSFGLHVTMAFMRTYEVDDLARLAQRHLDHLLALNDPGMRDAAYLLRIVADKLVPEHHVNYPCPGIAFCTSINYGNRDSILLALAPFVQELCGQRGESLFLIFNSDQGGTVYWDFYQRDATSFSVHHSSAESRDLN